MHDIALMYDYGEGTKEDIEKALYRYEKSADEGNADSAFKAGEYYFDGYLPFIQVDYFKGSKLFLKAVNLGDEKAKYYLAMSFIYGANNDGFS